MDTTSELPSFPSIDSAIVERTLSAPPFVTIEGIFNLRDFGAGYPAGSARIIKPLHLFRSGEPSRITPTGIAQLRALGLKKVFDLRAELEISKYKTANPEIEGVEFVRASILEETLDPVGIALRLQEFSENEADAFLKLYTRILKTGGTALEQILIHLRDNADAPCLVHCTAGKDRSGLLAAVILMLLGARDEDIVMDYALTTIGLQPVFPLLAARFQKEDAFRNNWKGTLSLGTASPETMQATLNAIRDQFGGVEEYVKRYTSLSDQDITRIRENMLVATP